MEAQTIDLRRSIRRCSECGQQFSPDSVFCPFDGTKLADASPWEPAGDPVVGTVVDGRYKVKRVLGEGGMGTVYEVEHATLGRSFAMKVLRRDLAEEPDLAARFIHEAKATAAVRHPHVVSISDFGRLEDGRPYFVMELLEGRTLSQLIKGGGPLPVGRGVRLAAKVARGLAAAHAAGVVHRDLKPENIVLIDGPGGDEDVRVVDFGAAMLAGAARLTKAGIVFGTPHYMSPEQAAGNPVDQRADVYSLGVIMYEMFTGKVPFEGDTYMGVLTQHLYVRPTPPSKVAPNAQLGALEGVILRALEKLPDARYGSMDELEAALHRVVQLGDGATAPASYGPSGAAPPVALANELEPPTVDELRGSVAGLRPQPRWPLAVVGGVALVSVAAVALALVLGARARAPADAPAPSAVEAPAATESAPAVLAPPATVAASTPPTASQSAAPRPSVRPARAAQKKAAPGEFVDPWK